MLIQVKNIQIYEWASLLIKNIIENNLILPIKVNFYLQKNKDVILKAAQEIEEHRLKIASEYGTLKEELNSYSIPPDKLEEATKKLNELYDLTQEITIYKVTLSDFKDIELTTDQMSALMFMIEDEEE